MKTFKYIHSILAFSLAGFFFSACTEENINGPEIPNTEKVPVTVQLSGMYTAMSGIDSNTRASSNPALKPEMIKNLPEGTTLWLFATRGSETNTQGYVVKSADGGIQSLYPCSQFNADGTYDEQYVSKTPLFLAPGTYNFSAISPAKPEYNNKTKACRINNGEYVIATNNEWAETEATTYNITGTESVIILKPLMQVTSRMKFQIKSASAKISSMSIMQSGVEIDGIQENPTSNNYKVGDKLPSKLGNKYNRIYVTAESFKNVVINNAKVLEGEIGFLPTDCTSTPVIVIMNLLVNDVPTQYSFSIVGKKFEPGYSYNYLITLDIKDGITVATWQDASWTSDVYPD